MAKPRRLAGRLSGLDILMPPGTWGSLWASVLLGGTVDMVEMFHEGLDIPGPIDCSDQI